MAMRIAEKVITITDKLEIPYVFKGSFKKANTEVELIALPELVM